MQATSSNCSQSEDLSSEEIQNQIVPGKQRAFELKPLRLSSILRPSDLSNKGLVSSSSEQNYDGVRHQTNIKKESNRNGVQSNPFDQALVPG